MEIHPFGPDDVAEIDAWVELTNATSSVDTPWNRPQTRALAVGRFRHGWDGEVDTPYLARVDGVVVGSGAISTSDYDNLDLAWIRVEVRPEHRRQGYGALILDALLDEARNRGRKIIAAEGWDSPAAHAFAARHDFEQKLASINRRQTLADVDWPELEKRYDDALPHATGYVLERWSVPTPADRLDALAVMASAINDAPTDDLDYEDEVFTPERMAAYETAMAGRDEQLYRVVARHVASGELAAQTVVAVSREDPTWGDQHDTSVTRAHRGHRLGLLLKADMLRWLREDEPELRTVDTWNAESNDHMIGVNEILGYRILGREWAYQRTL